MVPSLAYPRDAASATGLIRRVGKAHLCISWQIFVGRVKHAISVFVAGFSVFHTPYETPSVLPP
jgi:hypothetical protein